MPNNHVNAKPGSLAFIKRPSLTDWLLAAFTLALAGLGYEQYQLTQNQLHLTWVDERAWMDPRLVAGPGPFVKEGERVERAINVTNIGKTPARVIAITQAISFSPARSPPPLGCLDHQTPDCPPLRDVYTGMIMPNGSMSDVIDLRDANGNIRRATDVDEKAYETGEVYLAAFGIIRYEDVFGVQHWVHFCYWNNAPSAEGKIFESGPCVAYNNIDANYKPPAESLEK